ncbi:RDD family protein [Paenibacillus lentus]|uniref:RDD family protein n=2 Tax=Paenibacillus lentus TaxID=1338368 RepID=A0A3Q8S925_9BACL|nr:RDD family protein [Paenibacillus lentus]
MPSNRPVFMLFRRIGATLLDYLLFAVLIRSALDIDRLVIIRGVFSAHLCIVVLILSYYVLLEGLIGSTFGKWVMRIRVVDQDGAAPGLLKAFIRTLFRVMDSNPLLLAGLPAALGIVMTERRQRLGDLAARTYVVSAGQMPSNKVNRGREAVAVTFAVMPILLAMMLPLVVRVNPPSEGERRSKETSYSDEKIHISHNGKFKITTSPDWLFDPNLDNQAEISLSNRFSNKYLALFSEPKKRFKRGSTLEQYQKYAEQSFAAGLAHSPIYKPRSLFINGHPAYQFAVEQEVNGMKVAYIVTTIETKLYYHWITVWTDAAKYREYQQELHSVISTFDNFTT